MIKASEDRQSFEIKRHLSPDLDRRLPAADVMITFYLAPDGKVRLMAGYLRLAGAGEVAETRQFDDGSVMVDLDQTGRPFGVEYLTGKGPKDLPEFAAYVRSRGDHVLRAAANELLLRWKVSEEVLTILAGALDSVVRERITRGEGAEPWRQEPVFV